MKTKNYTIAGETYTILNCGDGWDVINTTGKRRTVEEGCATVKDAIECIYEDAIGYVPVHFVMEV